MCCAKKNVSFSLALDKVSIFLIKVLLLCADYTAINNAVLVYYFVVSVSVSLLTKMAGGTANIIMLLTGFTVYSVTLHRRSRCRVLLLTETNQSSQLSFQIDILTELRYAITQ